jgi:hypothetical protein
MKKMGAYSLKRRDLLPFLMPHITASPPRRTSLPLPDTKKKIRNIFLVKTERALFFAQHSNSRSFQKRQIRESKLPADDKVNTIFCFVSFRLREGSFQHCYRMEPHYAGI